MTPILFGVSIVIFLILHLVPGDPARLVAGLARRDTGFCREVEELRGVAVGML